MKFAVRSTGHCLPTIPGDVTMEEETEIVKKIAESESGGDGEEVEALQGKVLSFPLFAHFSFDRHVCLFLRESAALVLVRFEKSRRTANF